MVAIPVYVKQNIMYREGSGGRFEVTIGPKQNMGKTVSKILLIHGKFSWIHEKRLFHGYLILWFYKSL